MGSSLAQEMFSSALPGKSALHPSDEHMYSIGEFSRINRVTTKTLRHYDQIGLLKPEHVDAATGYRPYSGRQLPRLGRILSLREIGFSLTEIRQLLDDVALEGSFLERRIIELGRALEADTRRLSLAREQLARWSGETPMPENIRIESLPKVIVASTRTRVPDYDAFFEVVPKMGREMKSVGAVCRQPAYCFTTFLHDEYRERDLDVEICEAVEAPRAETESLKFREVEAVPEAACITHRGPYSTLRDSYNALYAWMEASGHVAVDHARECYVDGIWNKDDPEDWVTIIQLPVATKPVAR